MISAKIGRFLSADFVADLPVGMAYLLGNSVTVCQAIAVTGRLGDRRLTSSMFDISLPTVRPAMAIARRSVAQGQSNPVGLKGQEYWKELVLMVLTLLSL